MAKIDWLERIANFFVELSGNGFDESGGSLPSFAPPKAPPRVNVPKEKKKAVYDSDSDLYTDDEIGQMSDSEFAIRVGGARSKDAFIKESGSTPKKPSANVFDDLSSEGITDREYGEMLQYTPTLRDIKLAARVKIGIKNGKGLRVIAAETMQPYQLIRHYSAALGRANDE